MKPALSAEEWAEKIYTTDPRKSDWRHEEGPAIFDGNAGVWTEGGAVFYAVYDGERHEMAALCLYEQEFGFTRDLLVRLRHAPTLYHTSRDVFEISRQDMMILLQSRTEAADRIEALLPPEGT